MTDRVREVLGRLNWSAYMLRAHLDLMALRARVAAEALEALALAVSRPGPPQGGPE